GCGGLIAFTSLAFGTVVPWSFAFMEWGIGTLVLVHGLERLLRSPASPPSAPRRTGLLWPVGLFVLFCALQTVPIPPAWLGRISPGSARMYAGADLRARVEQEAGAPVTPGHDALVSP